MIIRRVLLLVFCFVFLGGHASVAFPGPTEALKPTLQGMIDVIRDPALAGAEHKEPRRKKIMHLAAHGFDFTEMSKRVLGKTWRNINKEQRDYFETLFTKLLENAYIGKLEGYSNQKIVYKGERIKGKKAAVSTLVTNSGTAPFAVSYVMLENGAGWQVYDLNIEGVSFLRNYREQFKSILRKDKFEGLVKVLEEKNESFDEEDSK
jgi:phospholipid transport system substrate-binding protein